MSTKSRTIAVVLAAGVTLFLAVFLMRPDRAAVSPEHVAARARNLEVRVFEPGARTPNVAVNLPVGLMSAAMTLAQHTGLLDRGLCRAHMVTDDGTTVRLHGADLARIWRDIASAGPVDLVQVEGSDGGRVLIRVE
jgi:hypothetical protein